jgi:ABC-2 type transport system permease protein
MLLGVALICGTAIFAGLFVCATSLQFFLVNGADLTSSFTYGCSYATSQPASIVPTPLRIVFGQLVPVAFTAYLPTLAILHLPGPPLLPSWAVWCTPVAVAGCGGGNVLVAMGNPALPGRRRLDVVSRIYLSRR